MKTKPIMSPRQPIYAKRFGDTNKLKGNSIISCELSEIFKETSLVCPNQLPNHGGISCRNRKKEISMQKNNPKNTINAVFSLPNDHFSLFPENECCDLSCNKKMFSHRKTDTNDPFTTSSCHLTYSPLVKSVSLGHMCYNKLSLLLNSVYRFIIIILVVMLMFSVVNAEDVTFTDDAIHDGVCDALDAASGCTVTDTQLETITTLTAYNVETLSDLTGALSLETVIIRGVSSGIAIGNTDVAYLNSSSSSLLSLTLNHVNLESDTDFSSFTSLTTLSLHNNGLSDLSSIVFPSSVVSLDMSGNLIPSGTDLSSLDSVVKLDLSNNGLNDLSSLTFPSNVTRLSLHNNGISDLTNITFPPNITTLDLSVNSISDASPLTSLSSTLTTLNLEYNDLCAMKSAEIATFEANFTGGSLDFSFDSICEEASSLCAQRIYNTDNMDCNEVYPYRYAAECIDGYYLKKKTYTCVAIPDSNTNCSSCTGSNYMTGKQMCILGYSS
ncbi:hypothetical protein ADUPG1_012606, partial [Aduncisulcus paluster]